jgi:hypothetical protein
VLTIGYYSQQDGLNVIWIVYPDGKYGEATTHNHLNRFFQIISATNETDFYGTAKDRITAL